MTDKAKILQKMEDNLELIEIGVDDVLLNPKNPKKHFSEGIKRSIAGKGIIELIVVDEKNMLLAGEGRLTTLRELGYKKIPVLRKRGLNAKQKDEYLIDSNQLTIRGGWDMGLLANFEESILVNAGFLDTELDQIFRASTKDDEFDAEKEAEKITKPKSKSGEIYQLGDHRLMCGDATTDDVKKLMDGERAIMTFTDPPYNVDYQGGMNASSKNRRQGIMNDKMTPEKFYSFLLQSIRNMVENTDGALYICMSSSEITSLKKAFEEAGGHWQSFIIWVKNTFTLSRSDWQNQYEPILYGWGSKTKNHYFAGYRDEGNVWENLDKLKPSYDGKVTRIKLGAYHLEIEGKAQGRVIKKQDQVDI